MRSSFVNFFNVSKRSPFSFLIFCNRTDVQKIPKGLPFYIFWHYATNRRRRKNYDKILGKIFSSISFSRGLVVSGCGRSGFRVLCVSLEVQFRTVKLDEILTKVYFCVCKKNYFLNFERVPGLFQRLGDKKEQLKFHRPS